MNYGTADIAGDVQPRATGMPDRSKPTPREAAAVLISLNRTLRERNEQLEGENAKLKDALAQKDGTVAELEQELKLAVMHLAGLEAELEAMRERHNYSTLLEDSGESFPDGNPKTRARLIYENAFDEEGRMQGIPNPGEFR